MNVVRDKVIQDRDPSTLGNGSFFRKDGLIYRRWVNSSQGGQKVDQLVVPRLCRTALLTVAHAIPLAGHMGIEKSRERFRDVPQLPCQLLYTRTRPIHLSGYHPCDPSPQQLCLCLCFRLLLLPVTLGRPRFHKVRLNLVPCQQWGQQVRVIIASTRATKRTKNVTWRSRQGSSIFWQ